MNTQKKKAVVLGGSRGIGRAIATALTDGGLDVEALSHKQLDSGDLQQCREFAKSRSGLDVLVLNTGGPPAKPFRDILPEDFERYHRQLFLGFVLIMQNVHINDGGFVFLISSNNMKEPDPNLVLSNAYRIAFSSVFKTLSRDLAARAVSCINIAPGPMDTDRLQSLVPDVAEFGKGLPMNRVGRPSEIGDFVAGLVTCDIKYLSGVTINFDGALSKSLL